ncbi:MAG: gamma-glutamyl-gamma-aminobutyrate hydrolase family protein [Ferruginibacter sp.]
MKIGLTYTGTEIKNQNYINWLKGNEDIEVIRLSAADKNEHEVIDALVMSGGIDMFPPFYGNDKTDYDNAPAVFQKERDEFETAMFNSALKKEIPILGICRGFQLINCILGGNMKQDLGKTLNEVHWADNKPYDKAHGINIEKNSLLIDIATVERTAVNSAHHQAIDQLGKGLKINCFADDGTIEGIEWSDKKDKAFFIGVQWHPERMYKFQLENSAVSKNIRDRFIDEIKKSIQIKHIQLS